MFNWAHGDNRLERDFAVFLDRAPDVVSHAKLHFALGFKLDYIKTDGNLANYYPDFVMKLTDGRIIIAETKGREDLDVPEKMTRLRQWCEDINAASEKPIYDFVYVDEASFANYRPKTAAELLETFMNFKDSVV